MEFSQVQSEPGRVLKQFITTWAPSTLNQLKWPKNVERHPKMSEVFESQGTHGIGYLAYRTFFDAFFDICIYPSTINHGNEKNPINEEYQEGYLDYLLKDRWTSSKFETTLHMSRNTGSSGVSTSHPFHAAAILEYFFIETIRRNHLFQVYIYLVNLISTRF